MGLTSSGRFLAHPAPVLNVRYAATQVGVFVIMFSFCARAGRFSFVDLFFPNIPLASLVFGVSVLCILKYPLSTGNPLPLRAYAIASRRPLRR